ncbi:sensor histidine kinase [Deinococcus hopiensis]|uniref:histidine kinase n=1 Tax=Deinococcus hopiensis KR-140 TaxID=695939 RepID=A0A1W1VNI5_9DEIO|nr:ATP-binding protein [Deinococcus hopiensis]SMB94917.1 PAS domain S-box-containing protein [Deinococcus hopiensis KR-140]
MLLSPQRSTFLRTLAIAVAGLCLPLLWPGVLANLFRTAPFVAERHDAGWPAALVTLRVGSDLLIGLSYAAISSVLSYVVYRNRAALPFDWVVLAFGLFIVACGVTHLTHVLVRYIPVFWFDGYIRALTATVSVATALALPPLVPRISALLNAERTLREHQVRLEQINVAMTAAVTRAEFLAGLSDALQAAHDPREVAELALAQLGPVLEVDEIVAAQVEGGRARLWSSWGRVHPATLAMLSGEGSPLERTPMLRRAVESGQAQYTQQYGQGAGDLSLEGLPFAAALEPILEAGGRVVGTLGFTRAPGKPWQPGELELARRAAATIGLALERTRNAQALRESEARLNEAMRHAPLGELMVGAAGRLERINPAASRILGIEASGVLGLPLGEVLGPVEWNAGESADGEQPYVRPDGTALWLQIHTSVVRDREGHLQQLILQLQDMTERRRAHLELKQLSAQLERSNRELQEFASVASHDLQEPVRKVLAFGSRLQGLDGERLSEGGRQSLERMLAAAERMQRLIQDLLSLSRVSTRGQNFQLVPLDKLLAQVTEDLEDQVARTGGRIEHAPLPTVSADPTQLRQLLQNLVGNALKYHREGVAPRVQVTPVASAPGTVRLLVRDNGIGFAPEHAERIFQPFQRLHGRGQYEGTGIGLAICRRIVERHGGTLTATGVEGKGSTFELTLPLTPVRSEEGTA